MEFRVCLIFSLWAQNSLTTETQLDYDVVVDTTQTTGLLERIWDNTGLR